MKFIKTFFWCFKKFWKNPLSYLLLAIVILPAGNSLISIILRCLSLAIIFSALGTLLIWLRDRHNIVI